MTIDRSQLHFCLRQRTLLTAAGASGIAFAVLPAVALLCLVAGHVMAGLCWLVIAVLAIVAVVGVVVGGLALLAGLAGESGEAGCGGFAGLCVGGLSWAALDEWQSPLQSAGNRAIAACLDTAAFVMNDIFVGMGVCVWSWLPLLIALLAAGIVVSTVGLLRLETPIKRSLLRIAYTCPRCSHRGLPHVRCPGCNAVVTDLMPSVHGVWSACCGRCWHRLATSDMAGRLSYRKVCANCSADLENPALGRACEITIAIVGAQSSGKSAFMVSALNHLERIFAPEHGLTVEFTNKDEECSFRQAVRRLANGQFPAKTVSGGIPPAFNVTLTDSAGRPQLLYLYDAAGEDFEDQDRLEDHCFHRFIDGIIFIVDPFAEPELAASLTDEQRVAVQPAVAKASEILDQLVSFLERRRRGGGGRQFSCPVAVVFTKMDAVKGQRVRDEAAFGQERATTLASVPGRCLKGLKSRFCTVRAFGWTSSLGGQPKKGPSPLGWIVVAAAKR